MVDADPRLWGSTVNDIPVLGGLAWFEGVSRPEELEVLGAIGSPHFRREMVRCAEAMGVRFGRLIHPTAQISSRAAIGPGCVVLAGAVIENRARLGSHVVVNSLSFVGHDVQVGDFSILAPGALLAGGTHLGEGVDFGIGAATRQNVHIGEGAVVGGNAMVIEDVPADAVVVGVPARILRHHVPAWASRTRRDNEEAE